MEVGPELLIRGEVKVAEVGLGVESDLHIPEQIEVIEGG
jgi:hypothetical protein